MKDTREKRIPPPLLAPGKSLFIGTTGDIATPSSNPAFLFSGELLPVSNRFRGRRPYFMDYRATNYYIQCHSSSHNIKWIFLFKKEKEKILTCCQNWARRSGPCDLVVNQSKDSIGLKRSSQHGRDRVHL